MADSAHSDGPIDAQPVSAFDAARFVAQLTNKPGVYQMLDCAAETLYVGKARNLRNRVGSYFRASGLTAKTMAMVARIADVRVVVTNSETEALLLEQSLIKALRPPFNIVLRDDKSYPYIYLTGHKEFARLCFHRGMKQKKGKYFGPFPSAYAVRDSLNILQKLFMIRQCDDSFFRNRTRPCLQYQIKRCSAPCVGLIEPDDYQQDVERAVKFLDGRSVEVIEEYQHSMEAAAAALDYERAARNRDQIAHLRRVSESQYVHGDSGDADIVVAVAAAGGNCVQVQFLRQGRLLGDRTWFPQDGLGLPIAEVLNAFLSQFYLGGGQGSIDIPREVVVNHDVGDSDLLAATLTDKSGRKVTVAHRVRGQRLRWVKLAEESASQALTNHLLKRANIFARFEALQEALDLPAIPQRLECFDISHSSGEATVASCVVFDNQGPRKSDYRRFNIEGVAPGDDYAAMQQALLRRYTRLKKGEAPLPDVLLIDGGKGQLSEAERVLEELQIQGVTVLGVAKGPSRRAGLETLILAGQRREIALDPGSVALHLVQHIRDEAHRFAITGHRQRRGKKRLTSELEGIAGVGAARRKSLLTHFGGLSGLKGASIEEIAKTPGINVHLAGLIFAALHNG